VLYSENQLVKRIKVISGIRALQVLFNAGFLLMMLLFRCFRVAEALHLLASFLLVSCFIYAENSPF